jgi:hypothetical protein
MATVDQALAEQIIAADGYYSDDPRVMQVVTYDNAFGGKSWAILYQRDVGIDRYAPSEYVRNPQVIWRAS